MRYGPIIFVFLTTTASAAAPRAAEGPTVFPLGGPGEEAVRDVALGVDGSIVAAGYFSEAIDADPGAASVEWKAAGVADAYVTKLDAGGKHLWSFRLGGPLADLAQAVACDADGGVLVTGSFSAAVDFDPGPGVKTLRSLGRRDVFVAKYSGEGRLQWCVSFGSEFDDEGLDIAPDGAGGCTVVGVVQGLVDLDTRRGSVTADALGGMDGFVLRLDKGGQFQWGTLLGGAGEDQACAVAATSDGEAIVSGYFSGAARLGSPATTQPHQPTKAAGKRDIYLTRFARNGQTRWSTTFGGTSDDYPAPGGIAVSGDGEIALTGRFQTKARFGKQFTLQSTGADDAFVARLSDDGNVSAAFAVGGPKPDAGTRVAFDGAGGLFVAGAFNGAVDVDPSKEKFVLTARPDAAPVGDAFLVHYDARHRPRGAGTFSAALTALAVDSAGRPVLAGRFFGPTDFDPGEPLTQHAPVGGADGFLLRLPRSALPTSPTSTNNQHRTTDAP